MVSNRIKYLRIYHGMTQEQLGEILGVGKATVQKYESGQIQNLKTSHIKKLCEIFNKKPHYFIFDDLEQYETEDFHVLDNIENYYGETVAECVKKILSLNETGQTKAIDYLSDLSQIKKYKENRDKIGEM